MSLFGIAIVVSVICFFAALAVWRERLSIGFQVAFLIRFQLLMVFSPIVIALLSWRFEGIFSNLLELESIHESFFVAAIGFGSAWYALALVTIVLDHAGARFAVGRFTSGPDDLNTFKGFKAPLWFWEWAWWLFTLPPAVLLLLVLDKSLTSLTFVLVGLVLGFVFAFGMAIAVDFAVHFFERSTIEARRFIFMTSSYPRRVRTFLENADPLLNVRARLLRYLGPGYVDRDGRPYADQLAAALFFVVMVVLFTLSFFWGWYRLQHGHGDTKIPALAYLEFLIVSVVIIMAGAAFYLDRYRIPVILALALYSMVFSGVADTEHYWRASPPQNGGVVSNGSPGASSGAGNASVPYTDGVAGWLNKEKKASETLLVDGRPAIVVVCASGGGIEAAAWTARVLTGLEQDLGDESGKQFARAIRLISSTSGGSVGSLFYVQSFYSAKDAPSGGQLERINEAATRRSLDATGWGFVNPDFIRLFAPWLVPVWFAAVPGVDARYIDRGWALEQAWRVALEDPLNPAKYVNSRLSDWRSAVNSGIIPATIFNATLVENGAPLLISTIHIPISPQQGFASGNSSPSNRAILFGQTPSDLGADISNVTASRLSATFSYVSPVAKGRYDPEGTGIDLPAKGEHVADGGYFDNYGVTAAVEWINDVVQRYQIDHDRRAFGKIVILLIDAFPEDTQQHAQSLNPHGGWSSEFLGPIKTIVNARTATQLRRDDIELGLLAELNRNFGTQTNPRCPDFITAISFEALHSGPLSWQLSPSEKSRIENDWQSKQIRDQIDKLKECLNLSH